jgi:hypothetical protein
MAHPVFDKEKLMTMLMSVDMALHVATLCAGVLEQVQCGDYTEAELVAAIAQFKVDIEKLQDMHDSLTDMMAAGRSTVH